MNYIVQDDGVYVDIGGHEIQLLDCVPRVNADGMLTIRIPARSVTVRAPIDPNRTFDMTDFARLVIAVVRGGLTIAQIAAVRPGVAVAVQTFMTNNSLVVGSAP